MKSINMVAYLVAERVWIEAQNQDASELEETLDPLLLTLWGELTTEEMRELKARTGGATAAERNGVSFLYEGDDLLNPKPSAEVEHHVVLNLEVKYRTPAYVSDEALVELMRWGREILDNAFENPPALPEGTGVVEGGVMPRRHSVQERYTLAESEDQRRLSSLRRAKERLPKFDLSLAEPSPVPDHIIDAQNAPYHVKLFLKAYVAIRTPIRKPDGARLSAADFRVEVDGALTHMLISGWYDTVCNEYIDCDRKRIPVLEVANSHTLLRQCGVDDSGCGVPP